MITITGDCINCAACAAECPRDAVFEPAEEWELNRKLFAPLSMDHFFIVPGFCNGCSQLKEIKCIAVCPMNAIAKS